ncbi:fatty acid desaturase family protein [Mobilicoccus caccae]|uniref:Stearoyl-CoA 9-desaturase n=1 Tax=Mobilicoccus caccae TaxID=1859295 RepID=A0ABQ6IS28_9MICO|nr:acyl-CoA desaturase [Mobilicoccus caccae]GMA40730.1 stearoyl-CoA 9-desaturase [Mobilicoccus caccae]
MTLTFDRPTPAGAVRTASASTTTSGLPARLDAHVTTQRHWAPKGSGKPDPAGHLTTEQIDALGAELDALRDEIVASRGAADAAYIRRLVTVQRSLEFGSRIVLLASKNRVAWVLGTAGLSVAKILENMEIGHNVMHGQWDWMRDPKIHSTTWEWDNAAPAAMWKHSHNELHHTYTNVIGADNDLGYGILRVDADQRWYPVFVLQPVWNVLNALFFQYSIALYDLEVYRYISRRGRHTPEETARFRRDGATVAKKIGRHVLRDYIVHPLVSGPSWRSTMGANLVANLARNVWTNAIIVCGHFPDGVETFAKSAIGEESRGEWYLRQMLGSANISGGPALHLMSGNLSHQIEHHMYPDLPSNRYAEIAPRVREVFARYDLPYVSGPLPVQLAQVWGKVFRYALPNGAWSDLRERPVPTVRRAASWVAGRLRRGAR